MLACLIIQVRIRVPTLLWENIDYLECSLTILRAWTWHLLLLCISFFNVNSRKQLYIRRSVTRSVNSVLKRLLLLELWATLLQHCYGNRMDKQEYAPVKPSYLINKIP